MKIIGEDKVNGLRAMGVKLQGGVSFSPFNTQQQYMMVIKRVKEFC